MFVVLAMVLGLASIVFSLSYVPKRWGENVATVFAGFSWTAMSMAVIFLAM